MTTETNTAAPGIGDAVSGSLESHEAAKTYIRDWCPDHVKDYITSLEAQPAPVVGGDARDLIGQLVSLAARYDQPLAKNIAERLDALLSARPGGEGVELEAYDAGLLSDFGGGDVSWWQDYIRAELSRAHDHYQTQVAHPSTAGGEDRTAFVAGYIGAAHRHAHGSTPISAIEHHARLAADKAGYLAHPAQAGAEGA